MKLLGIESAATAASAALLQDDVIIAEYTVNLKLTHSQTLLPMIDSICTMTGRDCGFGGAWFVYRTQNRQRDGKGPWPGAEKAGSRRVNVSSDGVPVLGKRKSDQPDVRCEKRAGIYRAVPVYGRRHDGNRSGAAVHSDGTVD